MKVYLIKTPECEFDLVEKVADYLNSFGGPMEFEAKEYDKFSKEDFPFLKRTPKVEDYTVDEISDDGNILYKRREVSKPGRKKYLLTESRLTFQDLFGLCKYYRSKMKRSKDSFVVLFTNWGNEFNFFSSFNPERNIFVQVSQWDKYTAGVDIKYPIAFQVIENILSTLMDIDFDAEKFIDDYTVKYIHQAPDKSLPFATNTNKYVHEKPVGCINDFCRSKADIILKLQSVNTICLPCLNKLNDEVDTTISKQAFSIFEGIRKHFTYLSFTQNENLETPKDPYPIQVDKNLNITITSNPELPITLDPIYRTFYLFILKHSEGVKVADLKNHVGELAKIYAKLKPTIEIDESTLTILKYVKDNAKPYIHAKSKLNTQIKSLLNSESLEKYYIIGGAKKEPNYIEIASDSVDWGFDYSKLFQG